MRGRKPKESTILQRRLIAERIEDAEYAFNYLVGLLKDTKTSKTVRIACANAILDRVLGKPKQTVAGVKDEPIEIKFTDVDYRKGLEDNAV